MNKKCLPQLKTKKTGKSFKMEGRRANWAS